MIFVLLPLFPLLSFSLFHLFVPLTLPPSLPLFSTPLSFLPFSPFLSFPLHSLFSLSTSLSLPTLCLFFSLSQSVPVARSLSPPCRTFYLRPLMLSLPALSRPLSQPSHALSPRPVMLSLPALSRSLSSPFHALFLPAISPPSLSRRPLSLPVPPLSLFPPSLAVSSLSHDLSLCPHSLTPSVPAFSHPLSPPSHALCPRPFTLSLPAHSCSLSGLLTLSLPAHSRCLSPPIHALSPRPFTLSLPAHSRSLSPPSLFLLHPRDRPADHTPASYSIVIQSQLMLVKVPSHVIHSFL